MVYVKTLLYGNFIDVVTTNDGEWINGKFVVGTNKKIGKAIIMPWNVGKDYKIMEAGSYSTNDRKAYSNEPIHDLSKEYDVFDVEIDNTKYRMTYIMKHNEGSVYIYGLKRIIGGTA